MAAKARAFGVEIECGIDPENAIECPEQKIKVSYYGYRPWEFIDAVLNRLQRTGKISRDWFWHEDGTLLELDSPILRGYKGMLELQRAMKYLREYGGYVTSSDGLHVHHDAPEFLEDPQLAVTLLKCWVANRDYVKKFIAPRRVADRGWGPFITHETTENVARWVEDEGLDGLYRELGYGYRYDCNLLSLAAHGTIELRLHEGTLDFDQAEAWVRFGQAFINRVASGKAVAAERGLGSTRRVLEEFKVTKRAHAVLARKAGLRVPAAAAA